VAVRHWVFAAFFLTLEARPAACQQKMNMGSDSFSFDNCRALGVNRVKLIGIIHERR
jgi:hypothetical protein